MYCISNDTDKMKYKNISIGMPNIVKPDKLQPDIPRGVFDFYNQFPKLT